MTFVHQLILSFCSDPPDLDPFFPFGDIRDWQPYERSTAMILCLDLTQPLIVCLTVSASILCLFRPL
jgi:hypothetical protein